MGGQGGGGGGGDKMAAAAEEAPAEEEVAKEKTHYDVELSKFDAATKVKLIKEVRALLGLGLKEAKETVESAPCWLKKELVKDEADKLKEILEAVGGTIRLA
jgi:large subunit ribosomal protein L7/L12